ncbi:SMUG2 DNA glycosylase family protein [Sphingobacterium faecale]|uniref:SMUG2 DNA glycosylase family protein n=1 Tax=Sphingobacterium faecale TaxID=2803775 RepID=A0ABS1R4Z3_9SPHI|nr:SMUG2 DNA glycosylase family protein [Sphingobacterium faecale]MBL1409575.1 SMUG2 DNA glycosylase family protein [Sphingobacterium faecale]
MDKERTKGKNKEKVMEKCFADRVIKFNRGLFYDGSLPHGFQVVNPYLDNPETMLVMKKFYKKYYSDTLPRDFIIGINPSRHGAGVTGVPFTDTKRLSSVCDISMKSARTHEISSVFMYDMIDAYGGAADFYSRFYINSPFPLAIVRQAKAGTWNNANYYDAPQLFEEVKGFMLESLKKHVSMGLNTDKVFVLGKKNAKYIQALNKEVRLFGDIVVLEHPRYIQQYKSKEKDNYIMKYLNAFDDNSPLK